MADVPRPMWVRSIAPRGATRAEFLIRCWFSVAVVVLLLPWGMSGYPWAWTIPALLAVTTAWEWLVFFWIDRRRDWRSPY